MHGSTANDIWAVGNFGTMLRWGGTRWQPVPSLLPLSLSDVFSFGPNGTWVACAKVAQGSDGIIL
ncbi:MAG: hypothetical protein JNJ46_12635 [Myxococcales bacterium]|nr:hypothetical protein [Myxococcales bacterium]